VVMAGAGARDDVDLASHGASIFGGRQDGEDGELLHGFIRGLEVDDVVLLDHHGHAVEDEVVGAAAGAVDAEGAFRVFARFAVAIGGGGKIPAGGNAGDDRGQVLKL